MDRGAFWTVLLLVVGGLGIMLYGVSLNSGMAPNVPVAVGGAVLLVGVGALTAGIMAIEEPDAH